jgi:hypothetical protein
MSDSRTGTPALSPAGPCRTNALVADLAQTVELGPELPTGTSELVRPPGMFQPVAQIVDDLSRK